MIFKNIHEKSYLPKIFIAAAILGSIYVYGYLMFTSADNILPLFKPYKLTAVLVLSQKFLTDKQRLGIQTATTETIGIQDQR